MMTHFHIYNAIWANFYKVTNRVDSMAFFIRNRLVVGNVYENGNL